MRDPMTHATRQHRPAPVQYSYSPKVQAHLPKHSPTTASYSPPFLGDLLAMNRGLQRQIIVHSTV